MFRLRPVRLRLVLVDIGITLVVITPFDEVLAVILHRLIYVLAVMSRSLLLAHVHGGIQIIFRGTRSASSRGSEEDRSDSGKENDAAVVHDEMG